MYSPKAILDWFHRTFGVDAQPSKNEVKSTCPECGSDRFYFNLVKKVGVCHKAACHYTPSLNDLIEIVGFTPKEDGTWEAEEQEDTELRPANVPGWPVAQMVNGQLMTTNERALQYLRDRGLTDEVIVNWGLTCDGERVYVPIYAGGSLVNYNSRVLPEYLADGQLKYKYFPGAKTSRYILGWEECSGWDRLCFVENTFVSLWLRYDLHCSTCFGSNLSDVQADLIRRSGVRSVALLLDEGAEKGAERGLRKLHDAGINAAYWMILGQPDDYPKSYVMEWAEEVFDAASSGVPYLDLRERCDQYRKRYY